MSKSGRYARKKPAAGKGAKTLLVVVCVLAILIVGAGTAVGLYMNSMFNGVQHVKVEQIQYALPVQAAELTAEATEQQEVEETQAETIAEAEPVEEAPKYKPEDFQNFLIVSRPAYESGVKKTNTMILCTMNKVTKEFTLTTLLGDALVETPEYKKFDVSKATLDTVYAKGGVYGTAGSMEYMNRTLYHNFGIEVDKNFELDLKTLARIVTRLGSVQVELTEAEAKRLSETTKKDIQPGEQKMDGTLAGAYIDLWSDDEAEDVDVLNGQKKLLEGIVRKVKTQYVGNLESIVKDTMPAITTSMSWNEFCDFLISLLPMVRNMTIENGGTCPVEYQTEMVDVDGNGTEEAVLTFDAAAATKAMRTLTKGGN